MGMGIQQEEAISYVEMAGPPINCDDLVAFDIIGGKMHFAFYANQIAVEGAERFERVIVLRMAMPVDTVAAAIPKVARRLAGAGIAGVRRAVCRMMCVETVAH